MSKQYIKRIGDLLIEQKIITPAILQQAIEIQKKDYKPLGQILIDLGYITQDELNSILAKQFGSLYINPKTFSLRSEDLKVLLPAELARKYICFPFDLVGEELTVVMHDPFDSDAICELNKFTNKHIRPIHAKKQSILDVLDKIYGPENKNSQQEIPTLSVTEEELSSVNIVVPPPPTPTLPDTQKEAEDKLSQLFESTDSFLETFEEELSKEGEEENKEPSTIIEVKEKEEEEPVIKRPWATSVTKKPAVIPSTEGIAKPDSKLPLPYLTFENFVVAPSNQLAWAAAQNVVSQPGVGFNPLFIYGGVGLGKTHLSNAIGNELIKRYPKAKVCYITVDSFIRELIESVEHGDLKNFQSKYRNLDTLLIDDVQFLSGQERTQEEFFYIFEQLYRSNGQMVITSDRLPRQIDKLEDRLRSRFEGGLMVDVQIPDLETRIAIFRKKIAIRGLEADDDIAKVVASRLSSNIRELEGIANRILAQAQLMQEPISMEMVLNILDTVAPPNIPGDSNPNNSPIVTRPGAMPSEGFR
jgi:chromosomal replication initiator protein DnaA